MNVCLARTLDPCLLQFSMLPTACVAHNQSSLHRSAQEAVNTQSRGAYLERELQEASSKMRRIQAAHELALKRTNDSLVVANRDLQLRSDEVAAAREAIEADAVRVRDMEARFILCTAAVLQSTLQQALDHLRCLVVDLFHA